MSVLERLREGACTERVSRFAVMFFCLRAVVPIGYMPAPIAEGAPFALCRGESAATFAMLETHHAMHHVGGAQADADDHPGGHDAHWEHCPLGIGVADAPIGHALSLPSIGSAAATELSAIAETPALEPIRSFQARAPPA